MSLSNDYFLLYHGISFQKNLELEPLDVILDDNTFTIFALIISANRKNYDKYLNLNSFKKLCEQINIKTPSNINEFHNIQNSIVELIHEKSSKNLITTLIESFEYLNNQNKPKCVSNEIRFTKVLTKYSTEYNNSLFIQKLCQKLSMDKKDLFAFFNEIQGKPDIINLLDNYEISKLDVNRIYRYIEKFTKENAAGLADKEIEEEDDDELEE